MYHFIRYTVASINYRYNSLNIGLCVSMGGAVVAPGDMFVICNKIDQFT
jgi:hypothetical protein